MAETQVTHYHHSLLRQKAAQEKLKHTIKAHNKKRQISKQKISTNQTSRPTNLVKYNQTFVFTLLQLVLSERRFRQYSDESLCSSLAASLLIV